jgi:hypothetical protein
MDQQIPEQKVPNSLPAQPVQQSVAPRKNKRLLWILAGIFALLIGIGIGMFVIHPFQK